LEVNAELAVIEADVSGEVAAGQQLPGSQRWIMSSWGIGRMADI
jgi:hypothetical protein